MLGNLRDGLPLGREGEHAHEFLYTRAPAADTHVEVCVIKALVP